MASVSQGATDVSHVRSAQDTVRETSGLCRISARSFAALKMTEDEAEVEAETETEAPAFIEAALSVLFYCS